MSSLLKTVLKCPYCPARSGVLAVDLDALPTIGEMPPGDVVRQWPANTAVVFDPDRAGAGPCRHLIRLLLFSGLEEVALGDRERDSWEDEFYWEHPRLPTGGHEAAVPFTRFLNAVLRSGTGHPLYPDTPFRIVAADPVGVVDGRTTWQWWAVAEALVAADPDRFFAELSAALSRYRVRPGESAPGRSGPEPLNHP